ncbi:MAG: hypothetical protein WAN81_02295, partial [Candidatus Binataceae bacterium]
YHNPTHYVGQITFGLRLLVAATLALSAIHRKVSSPARYRGIRWFWTLPPADSSWRRQAAVIVDCLDQAPALALLTSDVGLAGFALRLQRIEVLFEPTFR